MGSDPERVRRPKSIKIMKHLNSIVPVFALALIPIYFQSASLHLSEQRAPQTGNSKDCKKGVDACFPIGGCVSAVGSSRYYMQENREACASDNCYQARCQYLEFPATTNCVGEHVIGETMKRACGTKPY